MSISSSDSWTDRDFRFFQSGGLDEEPDVDYDGIPDSQDQDIQVQDPTGFDDVDVRRFTKEDMEFTSLNTIAYDRQELVKLIFQEVLQSLFTIKDGISYPSNTFIDMVAASSKSTDDRREIPKAVMDMSLQCFNLLTGIINGVKGNILAETNKTIDGASPEARARVEEAFGNTTERDIMLAFNLSYGLTSAFEELAVGIELRRTNAIRSMAVSIISQALEAYPSNEIQFENANDPRIISGWPRVQAILQTSDSSSTVYLWALTQFMLFAYIHLLDPTATNRAKFSGVLRYHVLHSPSFGFQNVISDANAREEYRLYCVEHFVNLAGKTQYMAEFIPLINSRLRRNVSVSTSSSASSSL